MHFCVSLPFIGKIDRSLEGTYIYIAGSLLLQAIVSGVVLAVPVSLSRSFGFWTFLKIVVIVWNCTVCTWWIVLLHYSVLHSLLLLGGGIAVYLLHCFQWCRKMVLWRGGSKLETAYNIHILVCSVSFFFLTGVAAPLFPHRWFLLAMFSWLVVPVIILSAWFWTLSTVYCCVLVAIIQALSPYSQEYTKAVSGWRCMS